MSAKIFRSFLLVAFATLLSAQSAPSCNPGGGEDGGSGGGHTLCSGANCVNHADCPEEEPARAQTETVSCDFNGNCHYCPGSEKQEAEGYSCDGTKFTFVEIFDCR